MSTPAATRSTGEHDRESTEQPGRCPLCDRRLFGWITLPAAGAEVTVGLPIGEHASAGERIVDRCENCGVALERGREIDLEAEWEAVCLAREDARRQIAIPNLASLQAWIGVEGWAAIELFPGRLMLTAPSLERLAARNGRELDDVGTSPTWRAQGWIWQTLINGLSFNRNFLPELRAGRLKAAGAGDRFRFAADLLVSVLGAPFVALVSVPLELIATLLNRGGELRAYAADRRP